MALFCMVAALLYADQNLMAPNLTQIADDFGFNAVVRPQPARCASERGAFVPYQ